MSDTARNSTKKRVLVTGGGGFVGQWLARAVLARGDQAWVSGLGERPPNSAVLDEHEWPRIEWISADVRRQADVDAMLDAARPDEIYHLAGISFVPEAEQSPSAAHDVNVGGTVRLLEAAATRQRAGVIAPRILIVGSGTQYGTHDADEMPLTEAATQKPANVYAATKKAQEEAALRIASEHALHVVCTRSFSHSGVGHDPRFLLPALARRVRDANGGNIPIGNDVIRDYLHVADVVDAYTALLDRGRMGEVYNVASGAGVAVHEIAQEAIRLAGQSGSVVSDPALQRPSDMPVLIGSPAKLQRDTGWRARRRWQDILEDLLAATR
jgi:GDP-4-dehydro-6-deoxy-D-mannose reductase